ncbi:helix-turn-helix transcriptional regulator [Calidifontibacter sp. DB0510]|uniref:Helix-turn-helix transcriptional regulator n=1 Tax=Metallococcus carri TaxID=1656884 RepID=A0A967AYY7_9MICO|nr:helix-turn-helix domain-containing protein [Metallococcus carri]NHN55656.1 helix-turn-helix transcriptional regulator [Metallococcus carri]NOP38160.1 helix-turn-helix transcriptional regulator [Calidifontibacter sp. DB2511S]
MTTHQVRPGEQSASLQHPMRHRLLLALPDEGGVISELARILQTHKGNVAHHLAVLERVGLVERAGTRTGRGGTRIIWRRTFDQLAFEGDREATDGMLGAVRDGVLADETALLDLRHLRLRPEDAERIALQLKGFVDGLRPAPKGSPSYGVLVGVYRAH